MNDRSAESQALDRCSILGRLDPAGRARLRECGERIELAAGDRIPLSPGERGPLYVLLSGEACLRREQLALRRVGPGDHFGVLAFFGAADRPETVTAEKASVLLRISPESFDALSAREPSVALGIVAALAASLGRELAHRTSEAVLFLQGRSLPRKATVTVRIGGREHQVPTGTPVAALMPAEIDGSLVVAGLLGQKPVSLSTPVFLDTVLTPLTIQHWEGRQIYANSLGLVLLEAAGRVAGGLPVRMGPSRGTHQVIQVGDGAVDLAELARRISAAMERICETDAPIRQEQWPTDEAAHHFRERGWDDAAKLLKTTRLATHRLVSCGELYALSMGPLLPSTGMVRGFRLSPGDEGLALELGDRDPRLAATPGTPAVRARHGGDGGMVAEHQRWLAVMGVSSVGAFNELCISGQVSQLIRVTEGFQEKRIGQIADLIAASRDRIRIISIAGPSSSGKTTFIKRLTVQLQINGVNPLGISLDDYYVDRVKTPKDAKGEYDFEALEALDLPLLQDHMARLLRGETVKTARYDFKSGASQPAGGPAIALRSGDVLMLEGIHGLNPRLLGSAPADGELFRVFIHPATTLPFDRLTRVSATDLRLLRRIIRDRHGRGHSAADNILRWPSVQAGERAHIFPHQGEADAVFDTALVYEPAVLKVYAERYLLEVPSDHPAFPTALRLRHLVDRFVSIYPDHVPPNSLIREFIGGSGFEY
jgi:uridine kinase